MRYTLAIDQGTTSTRAILFDAQMRPAFTAHKEFRQIFPCSGWVEHDAEEIWQSVLETSRSVIEQAGVTARDIAGIGITNQRETTLVWDRKTGVPLCNAIVWQDRRTADECERLRREGHADMVTQSTGLVLDAYFSGTKLAWILDNIEGARVRAEAGQLAFGTIDSFLIWRLTKGQQHVTDMTNACRTMLFDLQKCGWSADLCALLRIPMSVLPKIHGNAAEFGTSAPEFLGGEIAIRGVAGDQHAAAIGQACFAPGMLKSTYGTGCFALMNVGDQPVASPNKLLSTLAYHLDGKPSYALEGSIFIAGAAVQWLRDGIGLIETASQSQALAEQADPESDVIFVPALTGLGAPYWNAQCRGAIFGLNRNSGPNEIARATLQSVGLQTRDLIAAMQADRGVSQIDVLRVDGGMAASDWTMQFLADILGARVDRPQVTETTALGAAWLAGMQAGFYPGQEEFAKSWALDRQFEPKIGVAAREMLYEKWQNAVRATLQASA